MIEYYWIKTKFGWQIGYKDDIRPDFWFIAEPIYEDIQPYYKDHVIEIGPKIENPDQQIFGDSVCPN